MNGMSHRVVIFTIVYAMNRGIHYWVSFSLYHSSSLRTETKSVKKNRSHMIIMTWHKQRIITPSLWQRNKNFRTPLEQANKMITLYYWTLSLSRIICFMCMQCCCFVQSVSYLRTSYYIPANLKDYLLPFNFFEICKINGLHCKFRLVI